MQTIPWDLLGWNLSGDIDGFSIYTDRFGKKIVYPKSPPKTPPTAAQLRQRARFRTAVLAFMALSSATREDFEEACRRASLVLGGCALYTSAALTDSNESIQALARQTRLVLPDVPFIP